ncbi:molybdenum cofactor guanylyltransferase [Caloranaerobacter sp. TR13]|uniref:molybdenum cofactor guanylyltransferase n=1 Tax=Caloranaerobacter sp. TR13 TaxID=1302151 RepID=UPI0006D49081|nr:molybdenum cofactor guanylyltransferase [Caloranaerobacter sp. TR13]KPU26718.1 molybdenum cofactor guanylyltransferase [Caloranaerobacter sp. TR13]
MKKFGSAVVLAGGKSTRMGFDKQLLNINGKRLISWIIEKLKDEFNDIIIVSNKPQYYSEVDCRIVSDIIKGMGPLSGIHSGLMNAKSQYVYFIACDMPVININYIKHMKKCLDNGNYHGCITQVNDWIEPLNAFYSKSIISAIECQLNRGRRSVFSLVKSLDFYIVNEVIARKFSPDWDMFINLNTIEEFNEFKVLQEKKGIGVNV